MAGYPLGKRMDHKHTISQAFDNVDLKLRSAEIKDGHGEGGANERVKGCVWEGAACCS